jgi:hypothetical protein
MMNDQAELIGLVDNPPARRLWLLYNALRHMPFDRAIELARSADAFVTGSRPDEHVSDARVDAEASEVLERSEQLAEETSSTASVEQPTTTKRARLALPTEHRERLLERLAQGAKNAELAAEFGVSSKQVQGLRIGCAREIAQRRDRFGSKEPADLDQISPATPVEVIVRYLRQQDDVVVPQESGDFLVNGRFQMSLRDLIARANRMRSRQGKTAFESLSEKPVEKKNRSVNGHPLFWEHSTNAQPRS